MSFLKTGEVMQWKRLDNPRSSCRSVIIYHSHGFGEGYLDPQGMFCLNVTSILHLFHVANRHKTFFIFHDLVLVNPKSFHENIWRTISN